MKVVYLLFALLFVTVAFAEEFEDFPEEDEELDEEFEDEDEPLDDEDDEENDEEDDEEDDEDEEEDEEDAGGYGPYGGKAGHHYGHYVRKGSTIRELLADAAIKQYLIVAANLRTLKLSCTCTAEDDSMDKKVLVCKGKGCTVKHGKCVRYKYGHGHGHGKYGGSYGSGYGYYASKYDGYGKKHGHGGHGGMRGHGCTAVTLTIRRPALSCDCSTEKRFIDLVDLINDAVKRCGAGGGAIGGYKCYGMGKGHHGHHGKMYY